jgi:hypothetical protein
MKRLSGHFWPLSQVHLRQSSILWHLLSYTRHSIVEWINVSAALAKQAPTHLRALSPGDLYLDKTR